MPPTDPVPEVSGVPQPFEQQARYFRLMKLGWTNNDACKAVGICRKTGSRWRLGRHETRNGIHHSYPAAEKAAANEISTRFLSEQERVRIADLHRAGHPVRMIAGVLGRPPSTVSRELRRNTDPASGFYLPHTANRLAAQRRSRPKRTRLQADPALRAFVDGHLAQRHSPKQISHQLATEFPDQPARQLGTEALYQAIYQPQRNGLTSTPAHSLRTGRRRRRPQRYRRRHSGLVDPAVSIDARPPEVKDRREPGHLEGDLIIGRNGGTAIGTLVERTTRFVVLVHLPDRRTAKAVSAALVPTLQTLPASMRRSLTWDQGKELAQHRKVTAATGTPIYFCHAHSPWERGSNENMNGLLRQFSERLRPVHSHA